MKIMVVDNDIALLRSLEILLSSEGHRVWAFKDPAMALTSLRKGVAPDVLVLDYLMPELTGLQVLAKAKDHLSPGCKVFLISGHSDLMGPIDLGAIGVTAYFSKPLDFEALCRRIDPSATQELPDDRDGGPESGKGQGA